LASGIFWAITMVRVRMHGNHSAIDLTTGFFLWGLVLSLGVALALAPGWEPSLAQAGPVLPLLVAFVLFLLIPGTYASFWGPKFLNPGIVGLLLMTEIVVGTITAALFAGEPFGVRELVGVTLITGACLLEPLASILRRNPAPA
ncbi:MAG: EamA family transporter, partial [Gammaproteobacteria bacterium]|nr:EamA family transporter [Gammaproteobacteria bacterium]